MKKQNILRISIFITSRYKNSVLRIYVYIVYMYIQTIKKRSIYHIAFANLNTNHMTLIYL